MLSSVESKDTIVDSTDAINLTCCLGRQHIIYSQSYVLSSVDRKPYLTQQSDMLSLVDNT